MEKRISHEQLEQLEQKWAEFALYYIQGVTDDDREKSLSQAEEKEGIIDRIEKILDLIKKIKGILFHL